jgi:hypothetical protein
MQFLKNFFNRFFGETPVEEPKKAPVVFSVVSEVKKEVKKEPKPKTPLNLVEEILAQARPEDFLEELKSLTTLAKQFHKDRDEVEAEVKRLARLKKRS